MPRVGLEPMTPAFERALDRAATVIGSLYLYLYLYLYLTFTFTFTFYIVFRIGGIAPDGIFKKGAETLLDLRLLQR
jgi:hypothetical protein